MQALTKFLEFALPLAKEVLAPIVRAFFQAHPQFPTPPSIKPWLEVDAKHDARLAARRRREGGA